MAWRVFSNINIFVFRIIYLSNLDDATLHNHQKMKDAGQKIRISKFHDWTQRYTRITVGIPLDIY